MKRSSSRTLSLLRRYLREAIDLGQIQFSPDRTDGVSTEEQNTPEEEDLYYKLTDRITKGSHITPETAQIIIDLLDSRYGRSGSGFFLEPPPNVELYRGHKVTNEWLSKHVSKEDVRDVHAAASLSRINRSTSITLARSALFDVIVNDRLVTLKTPYVTTEMRGWSKNPEISCDWAAQYATAGDRYASPGGEKLDSRESGSGIAAVLVVTPASAGSRFLDFETSMYKTSPSYAMDEERECVNLGPVTVKQVAIAFTKPY